MEMLDLSLCLFKHNCMTTKRATLQLHVLDARRNGPQHRLNRRLEGPQERYYVYMYSVDSLPQLHSWGHRNTSLVNMLIEISQLLRRS
jgi:hypothetical protein